MIIKRHLVLSVILSASLLAFASCSSSAEPVATTSTAESATADEHSDEDHEDHADEHGDHDGASGGLDAHVHGAAELFVAWSGSDVVVDLVSPAINIVGFEYEPQTDEDKLVVADQFAVLTEPGMIAFNDEAACTRTGTVDPRLDVDGSHAEVTTSWMFTCDNPDKLTSLDASELFSDFPGILDLDAQWASDAGQSASELSPSSTVLRFG